MATQDEIRVKDVTPTIDAFRTGDKMLVDGPSGTANMSKDTLLQLTAQNALAGNMAPAFDPTRTYIADEKVMYQGRLYRFKVDHYGEWASADVSRVNLVDDLPNDFVGHKLLSRLVGNRLDESLFVQGSYVSDTGEVIASDSMCDSGLCPCLPGEVLYFWQDVDSSPNRFYKPVLFYDIDKKFINGFTSDVNVRKQVVPDNAFYFSVALSCREGQPIKTVVANYKPGGFIPYSSSFEDTHKVVKSVSLAENLLDLSALTEGRYISGVSNGEEVWTTDETAAESDFIDVGSRFLFAWYNYRSDPTLWYGQTVAMYDANKNPLRVRTSGIGNNVLFIPGDTFYVRIKIGLSRKSEICYGPHPFDSYVPYGYNPKLVLTKDISHSLGYDSFKVSDQKVVTERFDEETKRLSRLVGNRLDDSQFLQGYELTASGNVIQNDSRGESGKCPCLPGETLYFWRDVETNPNRFAYAVSFFDIDKNYIGSYYSDVNVRKQVVPNNAYYFSVPITYSDGQPVKTVVANYQPDGFIPYSSSFEDTHKVVKSVSLAENLLDLSALTEGRYISGVSNGEEVWTTDETAAESDFIDVRGKFLFAWYNYRSDPTLWYGQTVAQYDANKNIIRVQSSGVGIPVLLLQDGVAYVRIKIGLSRKYDICYGPRPFDAYVPFGRSPKVITSFDLAKESGQRDDVPMSQKAVTDLFADAGGDPSEFTLDMTGSQTDVLAVARNYVLKEYEEESTRYFEFSNDSGKTFVKVENTIGQVNFVHFFSTGRVLICGATKCYYTDDFLTFTESDVFDLDGSVFIPENHHFFRPGNYDSEYTVLNDKEVLIWNDYNTEAGYKSRVWFTDDFGENIRCILKSNESLDSDGNVITVRHFHRAYYENGAELLWVTSGDVADECKLICGKCENGVWSFDVINKGYIYKFTQMWIKRPYAYFVTDYTTGEYPTGLIACKVDSLDDPSKFRYIYKMDAAEPVSKYYEDELGYRILLPDGIGYKKVWFANGNFDFKQIAITGTADTFTFNSIFGPNYRGDVIAIGRTNGYQSSTNPSMNMYPRYDLGLAMRRVGFKRFGALLGI